jgi:hypothetical protein
MKERNQNRVKSGNPAKIRKDGLMGRKKAVTRLFSHYLVISTDVLQLISILKYS